MTELYYRLDGRSPGVIMGKEPKTFEEVESIKDWKEREMWTGIALSKGRTEEDFINSFHSMSKSTKKRALIKLKEAQEITTPDVRE